jgi:hypothetical protein
MNKYQHINKFKKELENKHLMLPADTAQTCKRKLILILSTLSYILISADTVEIVMLPHSDTTNRHHPYIYTTADRQYIDTTLSYCHILILPAYIDNILILPADRAHILIPPADRANILIPSADTANILIQTADTAYILIPPADRANILILTADTCHILIITADTCHILIL